MRFATSPERTPRTANCSYRCVHDDTLVDHPLPDANAAAADLLQPGHHAQGGRLAASRRPHQHEELAVANAEIEIGDRSGAVGEDLGHLFEDHFSHSPSALGVDCSLTVARR
ncbi:hypothetical protein BH24ACT1_BH24ACT1_00920 [soil metagenome]